MRSAFPGLPYVSLEEPDIRQVALTDLRGFLSNYPTGAILDEIQNEPDLLSYLQKIVDVGLAKKGLNKSRALNIIHQV